MYALIFSLDPNYAESQPEVTEYDRFKKNVGQQQVPAWLPDDCPVQSLTAMQSLSEPERRSLLIMFLGIEEDVYARLSEFIPTSLMLPFMVVIYWTKHAEPPVTEAQLSSLLVCILYRHILDTSGEHRKSLTARIGINQAEASATEKKIRKFTKSEYFSKNTLVFIDVLSSCARFQSCLFYAGMLNELLASPLPAINAANLLNGSLNYNLYCELKRRSNPAASVENLLVHGSTVQVYFSRLNATVRELGTVGKVAKYVSKKQQKRKKKKGKAKQTTPQPTAEIQSPASEDEQQGSSEGRQSLKVKCSLTNKFQLLGLD